MLDVLYVWQLEKVKSLISRAKYGCASVSNPISALQRDSDCSNDTSYDDASMRSMYGDQLTQLENLITRQHVCQQQMREQLIAVEKQYHSVVLVVLVYAVLSPGRSMVQKFTNCPEINKAS